MPDVSLLCQSVRKKNVIKKNLQFQSIDQSFCKPGYLLFLFALMYYFVLYIVLLPFYFPDYSWYNTQSCKTLVLQIIIPKPEDHASTSNTRKQEHVFTYIENYAHFNTDSQSEIVIIDLLFPSIYRSCNEIDFLYKREFLLNP